MKVLTAAQMREIDRRTIAMGIPSLILMENAGHRVSEFLASAFAPLGDQHVVVLCGKGNNGGDGLVVARQLHTHLRPRRLDVVLAADPAELAGDAAANLRMLAVCGCVVQRAVSPEMRRATVVVDALLGTGLKGPATGAMLELIREIRGGFPGAKVVAVDLPSGLPSDTGAILGESVRADYTVTFTAPKVGQVLPPACDRVGELHVCGIGSPASLYEEDDSVFLSLVERKWFGGILGKRPAGSHKGDFGHVLVVAGSRGKSGAAAMAGMAALRAGAGLVTVAAPESATAAVAAHAPELMTEPLPETPDGGISLRALEAGALPALIPGKDVVAIGPGLGTHAETVEVVRRLAAGTPQYVVVDADGLNALAGTSFHGNRLILTPHPGEMGRLTGRRTSEVQADRLGVAREFARERGVTLVLKGQRTLIALANGEVWINPTGGPAMATGGSGDILTGLLAGLVAQAPQEAQTAVAAAVYLHGRTGELGAAALGERPLIATDLLEFLPEAMEECAGASD